MKSLQGQSMDFNQITLIANVAGLVLLPWFLAQDSKYRIAGVLVVVLCIFALNFADVQARYALAAALWRACIATAALSLCGWGIYRVMRRSRK